MIDREMEFFEQAGIKYVRTLGRGSFGTIFLVYSSQYNMNFALKKIPIKYFNEEEVKIMINIDSTRFVRLYNYYKFEQSVYLLMEYCPQDLLHLAKRRIAPMTLSNYIYEMMLCIKACHDNNIAHYDIKPSNFLIDQYGHIKISDFGLSKIYEAEPESLERRGSLHYMAPEMFRFDVYNPMVSDIWSLGVSIYYMATGKYPFSANSDSELMRIIYNGKYNEELVADPKLREIIAKCIVVDPKKRASIDELFRSSYFCEGLKCTKWYSMKTFVQVQNPKNLIVRPNLSDRSKLGHRLMPSFHQQRLIID